jgi:hypothetical protein
MTVFVIVLGVIVWLYTIVAIHNGGGFTMTVAVVATFAVAIAGMVTAFWTGDLMMGWAIIAAIVTGFLVQIRARDDGLIN